MVIICLLTTLIGTKPTSFVKNFRCYMLIQTILFHYQLIPNGFVQLVEENIARIILTPVVMNQKMSLGIRKIVEGNIIM